MDVPAGSLAAKSGLRTDDVIIACNGGAMRTVGDLQQAQQAAAGKPLALSVSAQAGPADGDW